MNAVPVSQDTKYVELKEFVIESTGLAYYHTRDKDFAERIDRRRRLLGIGSYHGYLTLLHDSVLGQTELDHLIAELTIGETFFFRDEKQFNVLRHLILPDLLRRNLLRKTLRIWSAGCASGAEPYSLSVVLRDEFHAQTGGWDVSILGTDVNRRTLAQAQDGIYEEWALRSTPAVVRGRCFERQGNQWRIADRYRQGVGFQYHNLVKHHSPSWLNSLFAFDLILCRNVMIYFDRPTTASVIEQLHGCLVEGAWLVVGHADHDPSAFRSLEVVSHDGVSVYRKAGEAPAAYSVPRPAGAAVEFGQPASVSANGLKTVQGYCACDISFDTVETTPGGLGAAGSLSRGAAASPEPTQGGQATPAVSEVRTLADAGEWVKAESLCSVLIERGPLDPIPHFYHALILEQMGRVDEAETSLRRSVYLDRKFVLAHYHLGLLLRRGGSRARKARQCFDNVLVLLAGIQDAYVFEHGDGIRAADLRNLTEMNLEDCRDEPTTFSGV